MTRGQLRGRETKKKGEREGVERQMVRGRKRRERRGKIKRH